MRNVGLGALVALFAALLVMLLRGDEPAPTPSAEGTPQATETAAEEPSAPRVRKAATPPNAATGPQRIRSEMRPEELETGDMERRLLGDYQQKVLAAAATCYDGQEGRSERIEYDYELVAKDGVLSLQRVELVSSQVNDSALETCIERTLSNLTWRDLAAGNFSTKMHTSVSILDLKKRHREAQDDFGK